MHRQRNAAQPAWATARTDMGRVNETQLLQIAHHVTNGSRMRGRSAGGGRDCAIREAPGFKITLHDAPEDLARSLIEHRIGVPAPRWVKILCRISPSYCLPHEEYNADCPIAKGISLFIDRENANLHSFCGGFPFANERTGF